MKLKKTIIFIFVSFMLTGCAARTGLLVEVSDGTKPLMGEAVATVVSGTFQVSNLEGYTCNGSYNQWTKSPILKTKVSCSDGRFGEVMVMRTGPNFMNGSGEGVLNDGTKFRVLMGDMVHYRNTQGVWEKAK
ncbi:MAG: hypothetical protein ABIJ24_03485 [Nitrospinota bacterium]|nr:hypothetical protein [Nitrospinota bacterium]